jgi:hypothetical protein
MPVTRGSPELSLHARTTADSSLSSYTSSRTRLTRVQGCRVPDRVALLVEIDLLIRDLLRLRTQHRSAWESYQLCTRRLRVCAARKCLRFDRLNQLIDRHPIRDRYSRRRSLQHLEKGRVKFVHLPHHSESRSLEAGELVG